MQGRRGRDVPRIYLANRYFYLLLIPTVMKHDCGRDLHGERFNVRIGVQDLGPWGILHDLGERKGIHGRVVSKRRKGCGKCGDFWRDFGVFASVYRM